MIDYVSKTLSISSIMRLIVEGAIVLYEEEAAPLFRLAKDNREAQAAFNTIGKALYLLREQVKMLEEAHHREAVGCSKNNC
ncbi:MAG: hypothetical protein IJD39_05130 [Clostridia bacterium]|nr:hypothetical protein [Clostridia bacterium]